MLLSCPRCFRCRYPRSPSGPDPVILACCECGASQTFAPTKTGWKRQGPYTLACGCDSSGKCCAEEEALYARFLAVKQADGDRSPEARSRDVTRALAAYHAHFS